MEPAAVRSDIRTWPLPSLSVNIPAIADSAGRHGSERLSALNYMALGPNLHCTKCRDMAPPTGRYCAARGISAG
jgi:hypothetical protein